jgi:hypothetical protein
MAISLKYILPVWSAIGVYTVLSLMQWNGTYKQISVVNETNVYPKTDVFARHDFTGIERLDSLLRTLNITFWPIIDGSFPAASVQNFSLCWGIWSNMDASISRKHTGRESVEGCIIVNDSQQHFMTRTSVNTFIITSLLLE